MVASDTGRTGERMEMKKKKKIPEDKDPQVYWKIAKEPILHGKPRSG